MEEAITKDIDLCRERKKCYWDRYTLEYENLKTVRNVSLIASLQTSLISFLMLVGVIHVKKLPLTVIWLSSTSNVFATGFCLHPNTMAKAVTYRDAAHEYGMLKCELETLQSTVSSSSPTYRQNYQDCYKKKQRLGVLYRGMCRDE